jgi:hypothetical protein
VNKFAKHIIFVALLFFSASANAQSMSILTTPMDSSYQISSSASASLFSNSLPLSFTSDFFSGGFLDNETKQQALDKLKDFNRFGFIANYGVSFTGKSITLKDSVQKMRLFGGYTHSIFASATFSKDAFQLLMFGNEFTIDNRANFDKTSLYYFNFKKVFIGAQRYLGNGHYIAFSPFISFQKPPIIANIKKGSLHTLADTSAVSVFLDGEIYTGLPWNSLTETIGGGVDIHYTNTSLLSKHFINVSLENLGAFQYRTNCIDLQTERPVLLSGYDAIGFDHLDSLFRNYTDSLSSMLGTFEDSTKRGSMLPTKLSVSIIRNHQDLAYKNLKFHASVSYYPFLNLLPIIEFLPHLYIKRTMQLGFPVSMGGAGGFQAGIQLFKIHGNLQFSCGIKTAHAGILSPHITGFEARGYLYYNFN